MKIRYIVAGFISGFVIMVVELTSTRIIAPYVGASLYTWTSVLGVILLGLAVGNVVGGKIADKWNQKNIVGLLFIGSGVLVATIPIASDVVSKITSAISSLPISTLLLACGTILLPSVGLGMLYPALIKNVIQEKETTGRYSGALSAWTALGSIMGTFATGFFLVGYLGTKATIEMVCAVLLITGAWLSIKDFKKTTLLLIVVGVGIVGVTNVWKKTDNTVVFNKDSDYYKIRVIERNTNRWGPIRALLLDADIHSIEKQNGETVQTYPELYKFFGILNKDIKNIIIIGEGGGTLSKKCAEFYKQSTVTSIEIDPLVVDASKNFFSIWTKENNIKTVIADGRYALGDLQEKADLIIEDAFNSFISVPWHLLTYESNETAKNKLTEDGLYVINILSTRQGPGSDLFKAVITTMNKSFKTLYVIGTSISQTTPQNILIIGSNTKNISIKKIKEEMSRDATLSKYRDSIESGDEYEKNGMVLTDDYSPIERLMLKMVNEYGPPYLVFLDKLINGKL